MKLNVFWIILLQVCLQTLTMQAAGLQALEAERELYRLVKVQLHGEPLDLRWTSGANHIAFSPDGKHLAVSFARNKNVMIYEIAAEKAKRFDRELEKLKQASQAAEEIVQTLNQETA